MTDRRSMRIPRLGAAALILLLAGCSPSRRDAVDRTDYGADAEDPVSSEAARTRDLESRAERMNRDLRESLDDAESEDDVLRAYQEFEASRLELNEVAEEDELEETDELDDEYAPEP